MFIKFKPDWEETKQRYIAWWAHEDFGRCALSVTAPKSGLVEQEPPPLPEKIEERWLDPDYLRAKNNYQLSRTYYGGEALPLWSAGYPGWDSIPAYLGCPVKLQETTGWASPIIESGDLTDYDYKEIRLDPNRFWWLRAQEMVQFSVNESLNRCLPGILAISGSGDILASLRTTNKLLLDVLDCPEYVKAFDLHLLMIWQQVHDTMYRLIRDAAEGSICWFRLWSPGRFYALHNDFSYMISPKMFREIFLPNIEFQTQYLDHAVYHVDGIGAFAHVDALLELPRLQAIQILPGAGKPSPLHYLDVLKKVQAAGKNLHISLPADEVESALSLLSSRGLFIDTVCQTEADARDLLKMAEKCSVVRRITA